MASYFEDYPEDWEERRRKVYERDDYECQICGYRGNVGEGKLHAHHITPISDGGGHELENLVTLCRSCHSGVHAGKTETEGNEGSPSEDEMKPIERREEERPVFVNNREGYLFLVENVQWGTVFAHRLVDGIEIEFEGQEFLKEWYMGRFQKVSNPS